MAIRPAETPEPPYYAVVFASQRTEGDHGYAETADEMDALVREVPGFLGMDSARDGNGFGITVGYFRDEESIREWLLQPDHAKAREQGRAAWYENYSVHVSKVERAYRWDRSQDRPAV